MLAAIQAVRAVEGMIARDDPFSQIEDFIETLHVDSAIAGALWLLAWAESSDVNRREVIESLLPAA